MKHKYVKNLIKPQKRALLLISLQILNRWVFGNVYKILKFVLIKGFNFLFVEQIKQKFVY